MIQRIAFTGYAGVGKDEAAKPLIQAGFARRCFGDLIKEQIDPIVQRHFGFSAFTEDREQKTRIRRTMESWGEDNYENLFAEFFHNLPERCVNTRLCRPREALEWIARGGIVVEVLRPDRRPATRWEKNILAELHDSGLVNQVVFNTGDVAKLHAEIRRIFLS
jgi:hypothetical protein